MRFAKAVLLTLFVVPVFGGEIEIEGKNYSFEDIIAKTKFEYKNMRGRVYSNPFDGKTATIVLIPGHKREIRNAEKYWFVGVPTLEIQLDSGTPFYALRFPLIPITQTPQGTISFRVCIADNKLGLPSDIYNAFIVAIERQREIGSDTNRAIAVFLTGKLDISGTVQLKVYVKDTAQIEYSFLPGSFRIAEATM